MLLSNNISTPEYNYAVFQNCLGIFIIDFNYRTNINISFLHFYLLIAHVKIIIT